MRASSTKDRSSMIKSYTSRIIVDTLNSKSWKNSDSGIRRSNREAQRYRLTEEDILTCCAEGYELGFRTFVLQGGEDPFFTDEKIVHMIHEIKKKYPDCALTLSIGEKSEESYRAFREAGADRYLLRHETADTRHYSRLHPYEMSC